MLAQRWVGRQAAVGLPGDRKIMGGFGHVAPTRRWSPGPRSGRSGGKGLQAGEVVAGEPRAPKVRSETAHGYGHSGQRCIVSSPLTRLSR